jgi:hypothetical protein
VIEGTVTWVNSVYSADGTKLIHKCTRCRAEEELELAPALSKLTPVGFAEELCRWRKAFQLAHEDCTKGEARLPVLSADKTLSLSDHRSAIMLRDSLNMVAIYVLWAIAGALLAVGAPAIVCLGVVPTLFNVFALTRTYRERRRQKRTTAQQPGEK